MDGLGETIRALRVAGGPGAIGSIVVMLGTIGAVAALQGLSVLRVFGAERLLSTMLLQTTLRDLAPTMTALMLAAVAGTAFAGELGAMRTSEETEALRVMGVDPLVLLAIPRIVGLCVATILATGLGAASAMSTGYLVAVCAFGASGGPFSAAISQQVSPGTCLESLGKAALFGLLVGVLACYHGMRAQHGSEGVGRAASTTVVHAIIAIAAAEAVLTAGLLRLGI